MPRNPFRELIGAQVLRVERGRAVVRMPADDRLHNSAATVHGGAICTLADAAIATALRSALMPGDLASTIEMKVNFLAPARGDLDAHARAIHVGGATAVGEADVLDAEGRLVAKAIATFHVRRGAGPVRPGARTAMDPDVDGPEPA
ncbi:PaaI family thioesterase [Caldinitratiruptor microaerophilus]|nr:PaaI family thioesterase [Caldinitratiruptor microaerophilus]